jgi:hypothetical protein
MFHKNKNNINKEEMYVDIYYWLTIIVFFVWTILFIVASCIQLQYDSMGNVIQNQANTIRNQLFSIGFIFMWIFIALLFLLFLFIYFLIPFDPQDTANLFTNELKKT